MPKGKRKFVPHVSSSSRKFKKKARFNPKAKGKGSYGISGLKKVSYLTGGDKSPFPNTLMTKFMYNNETTLTSTSGSWAQNLFRLNSLYDPDASGAGGQPRYMDTLLGASGGNAPYSRYRVHAAHVVVEFQSKTTTTSIGDVILMRYTTQAASSAVGARESPNSMVQTLNTLGAGSGSQKKMEFFCKIKDVEGLVDLADNPNFEAEYNANPANPVNLLVGYEDVLGNTSAVVARVSIVYYAQLLDLNQAAMS